MAEVHACIDEKAGSHSQEQEIVVDVCHTPFVVVIEVQVVIMKVAFLHESFSELQKTVENSFRIYFEKFLQHFLLYTLKIACLSEIHV